MISVYVGFVVNRLTVTLYIAVRVFLTMSGMLFLETAVQNCTGPDLAQEGAAGCAYTRLLKAARCAPFRMQVPTGPIPCMTL